MKSFKNGQIGAVFLVFTKRMQISCFGAYVGILNRFPFQAEGFRKAYSLPFSLEVDKDCFNYVKETATCQWPMYTINAYNELKAENVPVYDPLSDFYRGYVA